MTVELDAGFGEGGGQIFRTAISLAALLKEEIVLKNIRQNRQRPGLQPQHLTALQTLAQICNAKVEGNNLGSQNVSFFPGNIVPTQLTVNIGTAGSTSLLLQTILPVAMLKEMRLRAFGGTDVPFSPPVCFLQETLFPKLRSMNAFFELALAQHGYYPKGNGRISFASREAKFPLKPIKLKEQGKLQFIRCYSHSSGLPRDVSLTQAKTFEKILTEKGLVFDWDEKIEADSNRKESIGSGLAGFAFFDSKSVLSGSALGEKSKSSEVVGTEAANNLLSEINSLKACDSKLGDQLIPFMALAKGKSEIHVTKLTQHTLSNIYATEQILKVKFEVEGNLNEPATIKVEGMAYEPRQ